jgi:beta-phosphoglucomutase
MCAVAPPGAVLFDFNGTISDDEALVGRIFGELFAELGRPLSVDEYMARFAGQTDEEIVRSWLGEDFADVDAVIEARVVRYLAAAADGSTVADPVREGVRYAAARVPVAVVSSATRAEIDAVLGGAGLADVLPVVVAIDDVANGKPAPDPYARALELLGDPPDALALEDTAVGIAAAKAAGLRCIGVTVTLPAERLAGADEVVPAVDLPLMRRLLG